MKPFIDDNQTDAQVIEMLFVNEIGRLSDGVAAMSQKAFRLPSGREPTKVEIESAFRRIERLRLMLDEHRAKHGQRRSPADRMAAIAEERAVRVLRDREFYIECFVAETGAKPSEVILITKRDGPIETSRFVVNLTKEQYDSKLLEGLRRLCGYIENGSDTTVRVYQDDATRDWIVSIGSDTYSRVKSYYDSSFRNAVQKALDDNPPEA